MTEQKEQKIVINTCYGIFDLSTQAINLYIKKKGLNLYKIEPLENGTFIQIDEKDDNYDYYSYHTMIPTNEDEYDNSIWYMEDIPRNDPILVEVIEELKEKANTSASQLKVISIPANVEWKIINYDGAEHIAEKHRTWR